MDSRFAPRLRESLETRLFPAWTGNAACRNEAHPGVVNGAFFADDLAQLPETEEYVWPSAVLGAMRTCAGCPVRRECLVYAYESEDAGDGRAYGVYGGLPGRQRERLGAYEDRITRSEGWFAALSITRRWVSSNPREEIA